MNELAGKSAVVTGASRGIGAAAARELANRGVKVVLAARTAAEIEAVAGDITSAGGQALAVASDVARYTDVAAAVDTCRTAFGGPDILVNNAGVIEPIAMLADSDPDGWDQAIDINVKGVYHAMRAVLPLMLANGSGIVINISSGAATGVLEGWSHYCASKAAVLSLTRCAHEEVAHQGVRVVGLSPGTVATDMQIAIRASGINRVSQLDPSVHIPPQWVGMAVAWLCTGAGSAFDGQDFPLKGEGNLERVGIAQ